MESAVIATLSIQGLLIGWPGRSAACPEHRPSLHAVTLSVRSPGRVQRGRFVICQAHPTARDTDAVGNPDRDVVRTDLPAAQKIVEISDCDCPVKAAIRRCEMPTRWRRR
jgi:hypothetical protein